MKWFKKIIHRIKMEIAYRKKLKRLKKEDPFIYKQEKYMISRFIEWILTPYSLYKEHKAFKKRLEELRKKDPFIYK